MLFRSGNDICEISYERVGRSNRYFLLAVKQSQGKTHQIRAQLAAAGCPVRGDLKYGARRSTHNGLIMLHARELSIQLSGRVVGAVAEPPADEPLWAAFGGDR